MRIVRNYYVLMNALTFVNVQDDQIDQGLLYMRSNTLDVNTRAQFEISLIGASGILTKFQKTTWICHIYNKKKKKRV